MGSDKGLNVISASSTYEYSAALCDNGRVYTSGYAPKGGIGHGGNPNATTKWQQIEALENHNIIQVSIGYYFSLFVDDTGNVWSCGENNNGQLGQGDNIQDNNKKPSKIEYFEEHNIRIKRVAAGFYNAMALDENGKIYGWGQNDYGQC